MTPDKAESAGLPPSGFLMRGEVIGADFSDRDDGRIVVHVAVDASEPVAHWNVVLYEAEDHDRHLPTADDVLGIFR